MPGFEPGKTKQALLEEIHRLQDCLAQRERAESERQQSEQQYRLLFENMEEGFALHEIIQDENGKVVDFRFLDANTAYERHTGMKREDVIGRTMLEVLPQADPQHIAAYGRVALSGQPLQFDYYSKTYSRHLRVKAFCPQRGRFATLFEDITQRKQDEAKLRESEEQYRLISNHATDLICLHTPDGHYTWISPSVKALLGYEPEELIGKSPYDLFLPADQDKLLQPSRHKVVEMHETDLIEYRIRKKDGSILWMEGNVTPILDADGSVKGIQSISRDITLRKQTEAALRESEQRYKNLFENSGSGNIIIDAEGVYRMVNQRAAQQFGLVPGEIVGKSMFDLLPHQVAQKYLELNKALIDSGGGTREYEDTFMLQGKQKTFLIVDSCLQNENGVNFAIQSISIDVTERKQTEAKLLESEQRLREVLENSLDASYKRNLKTDAYDYLSPVFTQISGYTPDEMQTLPIEAILDLMHPDDQLEVKRVIKESMSGDASMAYQVDYRFKYKDGPYRWFHDQFIVVRDAQGLPQARIGSVSDITERKQVEVALGESELKYRTLFETSMDGILLTMPDGRITAANPAACRMFGMTEEEIIQGGRTGTVDTSDPRLGPALEERARTGIFKGELTYLRKDGTRFPVELSSAIHPTGGKETKSNIIFRDISERKQVQQTLKENEEKYHVIFNNEIYAICIFDLQTLELLDVNDAYTRLYGYSREDLLAGMTIHDITAEHQDSDDKTQQAIHEGTIFIPLRYHRKKDGTVFPVEIVGGPYVWKGKPVMFALAHDISDRIRTEEALKASEVNFSTFFNSVDDLLFVLDMEGRIIQANATACRRLKYTGEELVGQSVLMVHPPERRAEAAQIVRDMLAGRATECPVPVMDRDGRQIPVETRITLGKWNGQDALFGVTKDISRLKQSEEKFAKAFNSNALPMALSTLEEGRYLDVNAAFCTVLGYSKAEVIGKTSIELGIFPDPSTRARLARIIKEAGLANNLEIQVRTHSGQILDGLLSADFIDIGDERYLLTSLVDVTERRQAQEALRQSELRYRSLFEDSPISLWEEDFSAVRQRLDELRAQGVSDLQFYLAGHPQEVAHCRGLVKVLDVNRASLELHRAASKESLLNGLPAVIGEQALKHFRESLLAVAEKQREFQFETVNYTLDGEPRHVLISWTVAPGFETTYKKILVSVQDITSRKQAEEALKESEEKYRVIFNNAIYAICIFDLQTLELLDVNDTYTRLYGYSREELLAGMTIHDITAEHQDSDDKTQQAIHEGTIFIPLRYHRKKDGTVFPVEIVGGPYVWKGKPVMFGLAHDISGRVQIEAALRENEMRYHSLFEDSPIGLWEEDFSAVQQRLDELKAEGVSDLPAYLADHPEEVAHCRNLIKVLDVNRASLALHHTNSKEDLLNRLSIINGEQILESHREGIIAVAEGRREFQHETINYTLDGEPRDVLVSWTVSPGFEATYGKVIVSILDITEQKQAEERLSASERTLRQIFQMSPVAMAITLPENGQILDVNEAYLKVFGYTSPAELLGKTSRELKLNESWEQRQAVAVEAMREGHVRNVRLDLRRKDGNRLKSLNSIEMIQYQGQTCMLSAVIDITELEQIHETLLVAQKMAGLGTLAAGVAHEINSPLQVITGSVDGLLRALEKDGQIEPERLTRALEYASRNSWRIAEMVRALSVYAHPVRMRTQPCDINTLARDSVLLSESRFKNAAIRFQFAPGEGLPDLDCDPSDLVQALVNLLHNACDALPQGGQISLSTAYDAAREEILLSVEDNGVGIATENLDKLFDPFFTTKPAGQGSGLGLTLVQGVARKYGGRIEVNSTPGAGSTFHLVFPLTGSSPDADTPFTAGGRYAEQ